MTENTCNNCMLLKKGDCFGKSEICEDFRYSPSMSSSDKEHWPTVMRSNRQANHVQYKKEQEKLAQLSKKKKPEPVVRTKEVRVSSNNTILVKVEPIFIKETIKKGEYDRSIIEEYKDSVIVFLDVNKSQDNYSFVLEYNGKRKQYSGFSLCQSYNAIFLDAIDDAISRVNRPIDVYIVNDMERRLDKIVDINSFEVEERQNHIKQLAKNKGCNIYELLFD